MQLKIATHLMLITCWIACMKGKTLYSKGCFECEEEVWEEVPCESIPSNSTTVSVSYTTTPIYKSTSTTLSTTPSTTTSSTTPSTTTSTTTTFTTSPTTTPSTTTSTTTPSTTTSTTTPSTTTSTPVYTIVVDPYKKCYCECKVGCKEFCRKVIFNSPDKQIVQVAKISQPVKNGRFESTHFLQREFIPDPDYIADQPPNGDLKYQTVISEPKYKDDNPEIYAKCQHKLSLPTLPYNNKPLPVSVVEPIYQNAKIDIKSDAYDFPIPFENIYSRNSKTLLDPAESVSISLDDSTGRIGNHYNSYAAHTYLQPASMKETQALLGNDLNYDDSFDSLIKEFLSNNNPPQDTPTQTRSRPFYSVIYS